MKVSLLSVAAVLCAHAAIAADPQIELRDFTARGFPPDLIHYTVPAASADTLRVVDESGKVLPSQITPVDEKSATLSVVTDLRPNATRSLTLRAGGANPVSQVNSTQRGNDLVLANSLLAVVIPGLVDKTFPEPVSASTLPAPILSFRSGQDTDFLGAGRWLSDRKVKAMRVRKTADGPAFVRLRYELDFAPSGNYSAEIEVIDQVPIVKITEEYDLGELAANDYWELDLTRGWNPSNIEYMRALGNGNYQTQFKPLAEFLKTKVASGGGGYGTGGSNGQPGAAEGAGGWHTVRHLVPDSGWSGDMISYVGLLNSADQVSPPLAGVVPLHKGQWRRPNALVVVSDNTQLAVRFPVGVVDQSWLREITSETSPFSMHEHDPGLPATFGRRVWALQLNHIPLKFESIHGDGQFYRARALYGIVGLDRYKDFVLDWPDKQTAHPRVFIRPGELEKYRATWKGSPVAPGLENFYSLTQDDTIAQKNLGILKTRLRDSANYMIYTPAMGHHHSYTWIAALADDVLSWPKLPEEDRREIRARLALLNYLYMEPDVNSAGISQHHGNPNMSLARLSDRSNFLALLPDHPSFPAWRDYAAGWQAYKLGQMTAPGGGWMEFGSAYQAHGFARASRGVFGLEAAGVSNMDTLMAYTAPDWEYYMNLLTPYDNRYYARVIPGGANSPPGYTENLIEAVGVYVDKNPKLAANLQWAWEANGKNTKKFEENFVAVMGRPWVQAKEPELTSRIVPGVGVIFRAHQGPDETYMYFRSGYQWSHWYEDQGHFILHSKGAALVPGQPYQYYGIDDKSFDLYNTIRFGDPTNRFDFAWPDSNILDHAFGPTVDYAWSSSGYPDWFISPGKAPGFGDKLKLADIPGQKEGAFHWNRQVMFLKGKTAKSPNYFVFRDTMPSGGLASWLNLNLIGGKGDIVREGKTIKADTEWSTKLELLFAQGHEAKLDMLEDNTYLAAEADAFGRNLHDKWQSNPEAISKNWIRRDLKPVNIASGMKPDAERHVLLRLQNKPGEEFFWVVYPRGEGEKSPIVTQLAPGTLKIVTQESTDYVFLSPTPMEFSGEDLTFTGQSGAVRVRNDGEVILALSGGRGKVGFKGKILEGNAPFEESFTKRALREGTGTVGGPADGSQARTEPVEGGVRFINPSATFAELTSGKRGVRGVGPFDLTITDSAITGTVEGATRTLVATKPESLLRPMFWMDGTPWAMGIPDDTSAFRGRETPQFSMAMGVTEGRHEIKVGEWTWPQLPPIPTRSHLKTP